MKTIEEKAKAYDEALERAEHVKLTNTKEIVAAAEYIFPELSESEDERIRKWIVAEIKHQYLVDGKKIYCEEAKDALAYLKKLKEQKPIVKIPKFRAGDTIHLKSSNAEYTIEAISSSGYHGKGWSLTFDAEPDYELVSEDKEKQKEQNSDDVKREWWNKGYLEGRKNAHIPARELGLPSSCDFQKEQKPTPNWIPKFLDELRSKKNYFDWDEHRDIEGRILAIINWVAPDYFDRKEKEQKPVEKQDYSGLNDFERAIHRGFLCAGVENVPVTIIKETAQECMAKIKPVEWSEEDEKMISSIIMFLAAFMGNEEKIDFLKSIRPHWKPSEEQMKRLADAVESWRGGIGYNELKSLYNDLQTKL